MTGLRAPAELLGCEVWRTSFDYQVRLTLVARHPDEGYRVGADWASGLTTVATRR